MVNHGKVRSTVKPENMIIDEYSVWMNSNIQEIEVEDEVITEDGKVEKKTHIEYEYDMIK